MRKEKRWRPTPALGVALLALFVALGGTSVALNKGEKKQIRKIAKKQANKRINKKLNPIEARLGSVESLAATANAKSLKTTTVVVVDNVGAGVTHFENVQCPAGMRAVGGGADPVSDAVNDNLRASGPINANNDEVTSGEVATGWYSKFFGGGVGGDVHFSAVCASL